MTEKQVQPQDKYVLRLPDGMRDQIALAAKANGRSMNAEIISRLRGEPSLQSVEFGIELLNLAKELLLLESALVQYRLFINEKALSIGRNLLTVTLSSSKDELDAALEHVGTILSDLAYSGPEFPRTDLPQRLTKLAQRLGGTRVDP